MSIVNAMLINNEKKEPWFTKKQILILAVFLILAFFSNMYVGSSGFLAFGIMLAYILFTNTSNCLPMIYFLIPMLRILDSTGVTVLVNIIIYVIAIKWIITKRRINGRLFLFCLFLFAYEIPHAFLTIDYRTYNLASELIGDCQMALNMYCALDIFTSTVAADDRYKTFCRHLIAGVIASAVLNISVVGVGRLSSMLTNTLYRFIAFANDPNYYSMYILLGIIYLLSVLTRETLNIKEFVVLFFLMCIGLLTQSKMFLLCLIGIIIYVTIVNATSVKRLWKIIFSMLVVFAVASLVFPYFTITFLHKTADRFTQYGGNTLGSITTGRSTIAIEYLELLFKNPLELMFGYGIGYPNLTFGFVSHNTYLDILLSYGVIGSIVMVGFLVLFLKDSLCSFELKHRFLSLLCFMITIVALSCLTADMFYYLFILALLPLHKQKEYPIYVKQMPVLRYD